MAELKVDRAKLTVVSREDRSDIEYWWSRSPAERVAAIQINRVAAYGASRASARLQRVLEVAERSTTEHLPE